MRNTGVMQPLRLMCRYFVDLGFFVVVVSCVCVCVFQNPDTPSGKLLASSFKFRLEWPISFSDVYTHQLSIMKKMLNKWPYPLYHTTLLHSFSVEYSLSRRLNLIVSREQRRLRA